MSSDNTDSLNGKTGPDNGMILVVDDEAIMRKIAVNILESEGHSVISATGGIEAIQILKERADNIRLVLLDLLMPDKSGHETFHEMKEIQPDIKVILVSGSKLDPRITGLLDAGVSLFIEKPYSFDFLLEKVAELLELSN